MKKVLFGVLVVSATIATLGYFYLNTKTESKSPVSSSHTSVTGFNKGMFSLVDPASPWIIVNKARPIASSYIPPDLVDVDVPKHGNKSPEELQLRKDAARALESLVSAAKTDGLELSEGSGYRSYKLQEFYYKNYVSQSGQAEADKFSARPGTSEHQTGWAADLAAPGGFCYLEQCFGDAPEGQWIAKNAYKYGYILRYPRGKEQITGYQYEPWHIRYVGKDLASELNKSEQTLEEFFDIN